MHALSADFYMSVFCCFFCVSKGKNKAQSHSNHTTKIRFLCQLQLLFLFNFGAQLLVCVCIYSLWGHQHFSNDLLFTFRKFVLFFANWSLKKQVLNFFVSHFLCCVHILFWICLCVWAGWQKKTNKALAVIFIIFRAPQNQKKKIWAFLLPAKFVVYCAEALICTKVCEANVEVFVFFAEFVMLRPIRANMIGRDRVHQ